MKFCSLIRSQPHYRADAFRAGMLALGGKEVGPQQADVLLIWNRYGTNERLADACEQRGGMVLVVENGYLGNDFAGDRWYAISRGQHNGAGWWPDGGPERWDALGVELHPWRTGREIVVLPQRGIGPLGVAMPNHWTREAVAKVGRCRVREHPGVNKAVPLEQDLADAHAVVTWGSGAALKALVLGVPVFADFPQWIGRPAAMPLRNFANPLRCDVARLRMFRRLAWAQWRLSEISSGEAFRRLLEP